MLLNYLQYLFLANSNPCYMKGNHMLKLPVKVKLKSVSINY